MDVCNRNSLSLLSQHQIHQVSFLFRLLLWSSRCGGSHWTEPFCMSVAGKGSQGSFVFPEEPPRECCGPVLRDIILLVDQQRTQHSQKLQVWCMGKMILFQSKAAPVPGVAHEREGFHTRCGQSLACEGLKFQCAPEVFYLWGAWAEHFYQLRTCPTTGYIHLGKAKWNVNIWVGFSKIKHYHTGKECKKAIGCKHTSSRTACPNWKTVFFGPWMWILFSRNLWSLSSSESSHTKKREEALYGFLPHSLHLYVQWMWEIFYQELCPCSHEKISTREHYH